MKAIPGASNELIHEAGIYVDRLSVNIEIPSNPELKRLAPEKNYTDIFTPMNFIKNNILVNKEERLKYRNTPSFSPSGQSTQLIVGATPESDKQILNLASDLYSGQRLKRVYYSGYLPVNEYDQRLPALKTPPLVRENRLYQSDWLMRFYRFKAEEILTEDHPFLDLEIDPKLAYALRNLHLFPINVNKASYEMILRVPGIGVQSAQRIIEARKFRTLTTQHLTKIGVVMKRAKYFIVSNELPSSVFDLPSETLRKQILLGEKSKNKSRTDTQLKLFLFGEVIQLPATISKPSHILTA